MLTELKIENLGIIEFMRLRPGTGLNIISGETGAGKSLILQALDFVLGSRANASLVRNGAHRALIEAIFDIRDQVHLKALMERLGLQAADSYLYLRREMSREGKSRAFINDMPVRLSALRSLATELVEFHGQHEHQRMLDPETHLESIDLFAGLGDLKNKTAQQYRKYRSLCKKLRNVALEAGERETRLDFLKFALDEIESFEPVDGEYEDLLNEKALIRNSGRMYSDLRTIYEFLRDSEHSALDRLAISSSLLEAYTEIEKGLEVHLNELEEARYRLESVADYLRDRQETLQFSPERLEDIDDRIAGYQRLHKKYGGSTASVRIRKEDFLREYGRIEMSDEEAEALSAELNIAATELMEYAEELSRRRRSVISLLESKIGQELSVLGMPGASLEVSVKRELAQNSAALETEPVWPEDSDDPTLGTRPVFRYAVNEKGLDRIEFMLRANPGENLAPLRKAASGGELSRIALAMKSALMEHKPVSMVIFDEVDAGVGGDVAHAIAGRLKRHSAHNQVLVVTHLHQVASRADHHFYVSKETVAGRTRSRVERLAGDCRLHELARMMGGSAIGPIALAHARELLAKTTA